MSVRVSAHMTSVKIILFSWITAITVPIQACQSWSLFTCLIRFLVAMSHSLCQLLWSLLFLQYSRHAPWLIHSTCSSICMGHSFPRQLMAYSLNCFRLCSKDYNSVGPSWLLSLSSPPLPSCFLSFDGMLITSFMSWLSPLLEYICFKRSKVFVQFTHKMFLPLLEKCLVHIGTQEPFAAHLWKQRYFLSTFDVIYFIKHWRII